MTIRRIVWILVLCGLAWVGAMAYVSRDQRIRQIAQEHNLSAQETHALRVCLRSHADTSSPPAATDARGDLDAAESACVCESLTPASVRRQGDALPAETPQRAALRDDCARIHPRNARLRTAQAASEKKSLR